MLRLALLLLVSCTGVGTSLPARSAPPAPDPVSDSTPSDEPGSEAEPPPSHGLPGCVERVGALPPSSRYRADDPRLQGDRLAVVLKSARRLMLFTGGAIRRQDRGGGAPSCWRVALGIDRNGEHPSGPKTRRGDSSTPEGWYRTSDKPWSSFYHAIAVHYPNAEDATRGLAAGLVTEHQYEAIVQALERDEKPLQTTRLGGEILIHGGGSHRDWTLGCIAMNDVDIDALRAALPDDMRTDLLILP